MKRLVGNNRPSKLQAPDFSRGEADHTGKSIKCPHDGLEKAGLRTHFIPIKKQRYPMFLDTMPFFSSHVCTWMRVSCFCFVGKVYVGASSRAIEGVRQIYRPIDHRLILLNMVFEVLVPMRVRDSAKTLREK
jgi:hypothetical protein